MTLGTQNTFTDALDVETLLSEWRSEQARSRDLAIPIRLVVEIDYPADDDAIARRIMDALSIQVELGPLFPESTGLVKFRLLTVPGVPRPDRADLFEIANVIRNLIQAETVQPDLGTSYFECERLPPPAGTPESADWTVWCWAPDNEKPSNADWALAKSNVPAAWEYASSFGRASQGKGISIFQPDTGVVPAHSQMPPDVARDPRSLNLIEPGSPPIDPMENGSNPGHGTGTGSVVASPRTANMTGAAPLATLVPIRCIESVAVFDQSPVARAIAHATTQGAHVITLSLGGVLSSALHAAVKHA
ncbi:S8 family serine peptidase, partial [Bradyrhizobium sp. UFLA03-84]|uniref:S8 family serine peptidase n=1 Tax=Bradyrhizobium sp. UFLA03-84 TaxID=418599 RepID=UPI001FDA5575